MEKRLREGFDKITGQCKIESQERERMKHVLILAAEHYDVTGPMKTYIGGYAKRLGENYYVTIKKMPYHMLPFQKKKIWDELALEIRPDTVAIVPSCLNMCYYLLDLKKWIRKDIQLIAWVGDCAIRAGLSELKAMGKQMEYPGLKRLMIRIAKLLLYHHKEKTILRCYRKVLVITPADIDCMREHYQIINAELKLLPYSFDVPNEKVKPCQIDMHKELRIGFLGHFKQDSFDNYFKKFFAVCETEIIKEVPQLKIIVAGRNATKEQIALLKQYNFVEYWGEIQELSEFYENVHLVFSTIPKQAGILTKVVEAFGYGKCVVGYRHNFASIMGIEEGIDYLGADNPQEFSSVFRAVASGAIDIEKMGDSARTAMLGNYRWDVNGELLRKYIEENGEIESDG